MLLKVVKIREKSPPFRVGQAYTSPESIFQAFRVRMTELDREEFWVVHLDGRHRYIGHEVVSVGTLTASMVHPREVFKGALVNNAAAIILMHNHPSGDPQPSEDDFAVTRRLISASEVLGIMILDHIVFGDTSYTSLKEQGCM